MSSIYVRDTVTAFLAAQFPAENLIDLTAAFSTVPELLENHNLTHDDPWLGIEFVGNDELPITINSTNVVGRYRETGAILFHVVGLASLGTAGTILARGEAIRDKLRGQRLGRVIIDSMTPLNFSRGATIDFEGGYMSASFNVSYECDLDL